MPYENPQTHVREVTEYVQNHMGDRITVREIADSLQLNASYLNTCFCRQTGESITACIRRVKMERACVLLRESTYSLTQVGAMLGYFDQSHFSRTFQKVMHMTPGAYRSGNF